jgi:hypothetical protein
MEDDSTNFVKYFTDEAVLERLGVDQVEPESRREAITKEVNSSLEKPKSGLPPIVSGKDFPPLWDLETRPFLVDGLLQRGDTCLVTSRPKLGKSFLLANVGVSLASGTPFIGKETTQSNVLMIDLELRRDVAMERLIHVANAKGFDQVPENLFLWSLARHTYDLDTIVEVLRSKLEELPKLDLVCVDPIFVLDRGENFDENSAHSVTRLLTALEQLTIEQDSALMLVHHTRKGNLNGADSMDRASGSSAFSRYPSVIMNLSPHEVQDCAIIEFTTRNFKTPSSLCYQLDAPLVKERPDLDPTKYRKYGEQGRSECFGADDVMNQLPNHAISKQEWFSRCRSAGVEESVFLGHFENLISTGLVLEQNNNYIRNREAGV